jgi:hypothetical protein
MLSNQRKVKKYKSNIEAIMIEQNAFVQKKDENEQIKNRRIQSDRNVIEEIIA